MLGCAAGLTTLGNDVTFSDVTKPLTFSQPLGWGRRDLVVLDYYLYYLYFLLRFPKLRLSQ